MYNNTYKKYISMISCILLFGKAFGRAPCICDRSIECRSIAQHHVVAECRNLRCQLRNRRRRFPVSITWTHSPRGGEQEDIGPLPSKKP